MTNCSATELAIAPDDFRTVMRHQVSTVSIVACGIVGHRSGLTATAACSLSDDPAMVMVCVNRSSGAHDLILEHECFSLNFLSTDQVGLAKTFAGATGLRGEARFGEGSWRDLATGAPILEGALTNFDCALWNRHEFSTHSVFAGLVRAARANREVSPLLYFRGTYVDLGTGAVS